MPYEAASGRLRTIYDRVKGPRGTIDNVLSVHSLRPHTLEGHLALYKAVLHHSANQLPGWLLETVGVYVSLLNGCGYCVDHHLAGLGRLLADEARLAAIGEGLRGEALRGEEFDGVFDRRERAILGYARLLTLDPARVRAANVAALREAGLTDGEILEINQVVSYFCYVNRTVLGLGVSTHGDVLGLAPPTTADVTDWGHG